jgi:hypothetical protein
LKVSIDQAQTGRSGQLQRHPIASGALLGLAWGISMRLWMRFISTDPEFSWSGTGYILGAATLAGLLLGIGWARRSKAKGNLWRFSGFAMILLGVGAGMVMIPSVLLGGIALGRKTWLTWVRATLFAVAAGFQVFVFSSDTGVRAGRAIPAFLIYGVLISLEALAFSIPFLPSRTDDRASETQVLRLASDAG